MCNIYSLAFNSRTRYNYSFRRRLVPELLGLPAKKSKICCATFPADGVLNKRSMIQWSEETGTTSGVYLEPLSDPKNGCPCTSSIVARFVVSGCIILLIKCCSVHRKDSLRLKSCRLHQAADLTFKSSDMTSATRGGKRILFLSCTLSIFLTLESSNGICPHAIMYSITPMLQMSCILGSYGWPKYCKK